MIDVTNCTLMDREKLYLIDVTNCNRRKVEISNWSRCVVDVCHWLLLQEGVQLGISEFFSFVLFLPTQIYEGKLKGMINATKNQLFIPNSSALQIPIVRIPAYSKI